jgi:hypothetical protein
MRLVTGHWEGDGGDVYLPIGFIPNYFMMCLWYTDTNCVFTHWWSSAYYDSASGYKEGIKVAEGVTDTLADSGGIAPYDTGSVGPTVTLYTSVSGTPTAKTTTAHGTYCKPTGNTNNVDGVPADKSAIFECITGSGSVSAAYEPGGSGGAAKWPVVEGDLVTDGASNVWQLTKTVSLTEVGYQGVLIVAALQTDAREYFFNAFQADEDTDFGDVVGWTGGIKGA